ncbi:hypothetical protein BKA56DRAFT_589617 [Ilyonectria sp. MPI-CAGE-AT-0026]|nr:hypothetical protein BKA56DRAFT_589617 [Ilyonectria sp. MPI-CAGE-AT-0026]
MSKPSITVTNRDLQSPGSLSVEKDIVFDLEKPAKLYCLSTCGNNAESPQGQWHDRDGTLRFLQTISKRASTKNLSAKEVSSDPQSLVFIAGTGNGTLLGLSLDKILFQNIIQTFEFPDKVERTIKSIHGVFARFIEHRDDKKSLLILFSSPKTPVREIFCAIRICLVSSRTTCLLFDATPDDLSRIIKAVDGLGSGSKLVKQNPLALIVTILNECGFTSELKREDLDKDVLGAEVQTRASSWEDPGKTLVRWPHDFYSVMSILHLCQNNLMFVNHAVEFEVAAWEFFQQMSRKDEVREWLKANTSDGSWQAIRDDIDYELAHAISRKAQIGCLRERVGVQISLIDNMVAHQETSQTSLIAILALVFAPASLIASIFSAGIFPTSDRSWVPFISSTLPITLVTVAIGMVFLERQLVVRAWWRKAPQAEEIQEIPVTEIRPHESC